MSSRCCGWCEHAQFTVTTVDVAMHCSSRVKPSSSPFTVAIRKFYSKHHKVHWVAWPGETVADADKAEMRARFRTEHNTTPVFLRETLAENFFQKVAHTPFVTCVPPC